MRERVVIKWGGGLITEKSSLCTPNLAILEQLAETIVVCQKNGIDVILVHGAGSFGHLRAKHWRLNEGLLLDAEFNSDGVCTTQREAVHTVRQEMLELNAHVCHALEQKNITPIVHPPHLWAQNTGPGFTGDLNRFHQHEPGQVHVTFGDIVDVEGNEQFGILSGDDLVVRLAVELPGVQRLVFAIKGVDGILRVPPEQADDDDLIDDEIIEIFVEEAEEVLEALDQYFPRWAANTGDETALVEFRRAFHTLKGSGRMVGATTVGELAWSIENMMNRVIDGAIDTAFIRDNFPERYALKDRDGILDPEHIADAYWTLHRQPRDTWTHELDLRPWMETF